MTVCIATLAQWQPTLPDGTPGPFESVVIMAADRMITAGGTREYELKLQTKGFQFGSHAQALISGSGEQLLEVLDRARRKLDFGQGSPRIEVIAQMVADEFESYRSARIERIVLSQYGLTFKSFHAEQKSFAPEFLRQVLDELENWDNNLGSILIAGIDESGGQVYRINDPGYAETCGQAGYATIGIGGEYAEAVFMGAQYSRQFAWVDALVLTYSAKKRAEVAAGVGKLTDLWWVTNERGLLYYGPNEPISQGLEKMFEERSKKEQVALDEDRETLTLELERINAAPQGTQSTGATDDEEGFSEGSTEGEPKD